MRFQAYLRTRKEEGFGYIDVIVGTALMTLVFVGVVGVIQLSIRLIGNSKASVGALALANEQMELLRSLPFSGVAVEGGIPSGMVTSTESILLNNIDYTRQTSVSYVDDPADGTLALGTDAIFTDYKIAEVEVSWNIRGQERAISLVSNIVPKGLETGEDGGIIWATVLTSTGTPLEGAEVRFLNDTTDPTVDVTYNTNSVGEALAIGAATGTGYEISVTKPGYSSAYTYAVTAENPNPNPGHLTVLDATITFATFQIDLVSDKIIRTFEPVRTATWTDPFIDSSGIASSASTSVTGGEVQLLDSGGVYELLGTVASVGTTSSLLRDWNEASWSDTTSGSTTIAYYVEYDTGSSYALVPDGVLPGNASGFTSSPIDLSGVSTSTYSTLRLAASLSTTDTNFTPSIQEWSISYDEGPVPLPYIDFLMEGEKDVGTTAMEVPIRKYSELLQTDATGSLLVSDLEWDSYTISIDDTVLGMNISEICEPQPRSINPGVSVTTDIMLVSGTTHSLRVVAEDSATGDPIEDVSVHATGPGYDETQLTSSCGQTLFSGLTANDYDVEVTVTGYDTASSSVSVSGATVQEFLLDPS